MSRSHPDTVISNRNTAAIRFIICGLAQELVWLYQLTSLIAYAYPGKPQAERKAFSYYHDMP